MFVRPLLGRDFDLERALECLSVNRFLTLCGPPGVGKSAFAHTLVTQMHARDRNVRILNWGDLASVDGTSMCNAEAETLVFDDADALTPDSLETLYKVCDSHPHTRIVIVRRTPLRVPLETVLRLEGIGIADGTQLMWQAMQTGTAMRDPEPREHEEIAPLVERLDGLPLALIRAGMRLRTMPITTMQRLLDSPNGLRLLGDPHRPAVEGSSLEAGFGTARQALSKAAQKLLDLLTLCPSGAGSTLLAEFENHVGLPEGSGYALVDEGLARLRNGRLEVLQLVRGGASRLVEGNQFAQCVRSWLQRTHTSPKVLRPEQDNIVVAISWLTEHGVFDEALDIVLALGDYFVHTNQRSLGLELLSRAHNKFTSGVSAVRAEALSLTLSTRVRDFIDLDASWRRIVELAAATGDSELELEALRRSHALLSEVENHTAADALLPRIRALVFAQPSGRGQAFLRGCEAARFLRAGELGGAASAFRSAARLAADENRIEEELHYRFFEIESLTRMGDYLRAFRAYREFYDLQRDSGIVLERLVIGAALYLGAFLSDPGLIARALGAGEALRMREGVEQTWFEREREWFLRTHPGLAENLRTVMGEALFAEHWQRGRNGDPFAISDQMLHMTERYVDALYSKRERTLLERVALGESNKRIGQVLGLAPVTVRNQLSALFAKLGVNTRTQALVAARMRGLLDEPSDQSERALPGS
jgi:DNA-binding CsgD family transcriptional regulator